MYSNQKIAEAFAQGATKGKSCNMFIDGNTIYSYGYHFPIATRTTHKGVPVVLFTRDGYSVSTAKHKGYVRYAISGMGMPVIELHNAGDRLELNADTIRRTRLQLLNEYIEAKGKYSRARKEHTREYWKSEGMSLLHGYKELLKYEPVTVLNDNKIKEIELSYEH